MSLGGVFAEWQPQYAERKIATFPVRDKKPAITHYLKVGLRASGELAIKFPAADGMGLACRRNGIAVVDVDAPDERLLQEALDEFGESPFVVRSGSGNFQAWYRHAGERRKIRPDKSRPIDILGDGYVVVPPSQGAKGSYRIIQGTLDDLARLPVMRRDDAPVAAVEVVERQAERIDRGERNNTLWGLCMAHARDCHSPEELMRFAVDTNRERLTEPLHTEEVLRIVASAWAKEECGENWLGSGGRVVMRREQVNGLLFTCPDAYVLLTILKFHHWGKRDEFYCANAMADSMPSGGWTPKRFAAARKALLEAGELEEVRRRGKRTPATYRFKTGRK